MLYLILKAQLGNQLFQIMNIISLSNKYNIDYRICCNEYERTINEEKKTYFNSFYLKLKDKLKKIDKDELNNALEKNKLYKESRFEYDNIILENLDKDIYIEGFFQSYKYFENYNHIIYEILEIEERKKNLSNIYSYIFNKKNIAIHFRLGDYLYLQNMHPIQTIKYYINSINKLIDILKTNDDNILNYNILFFCNECDNIIVNKYIDILNKTYNNKLNFIKINDSICEWEQILMISLCNNIIISNSTFSWWGAYLSEKNTNVIYPTNWFGPYYKNNKLVDLILDNWIGVEDI
tara:strand:- start:2658 stop:3536 length:879 start_codon:yes stop_codon:yes gene_type:complete